MLGGDPCADGRPCLFCFCFSSCLLCLFLFLFFFSWSVFLFFSCSSILASSSFYLFFFLSSFVSFLLLSFSSFVFGTTFVLLFFWGKDVYFCSFPSLLLPFPPIFSSPFRSHFLLSPLLILFPSLSPLLILLPPPIPSSFPHSPISPLLSHCSPLPFPSR